MSLSDRIYLTEHILDEDFKQDPSLRSKDVREAVKELKERIIPYLTDTQVFELNFKHNIFAQIIDEIFGEKLI